MQQKVLPADKLLEFLNHQEQVVGGAGRGVSDLPHKNKSERQWHQELLLHLQGYLPINTQTFNTITNLKPHCIHTSKANDFDYDPMSN
jgi:hypothetical protein